MFKKIYMPFLLSCMLASMIHYVHAGVDEADLHFMTKPQLIALIKDQQQSKETEKILTAFKTALFTYVATHAAYWWFNINPQTAHKTFFRTLFRL